MKRTIAVGIAASAMLVGPAALANAAEKPHHETKAEKKADRIHDRRVARREARTPKPPQDTTTTPRAPGPSGSGPAPGTSASDRSGPGLVRRGVVSCGVSGDRAGASFTVTNGCDTAQTLTVSIQSQPAVWHVGLCQAGGCTLVRRYTVQVAPGTHTIGLDLPCGYSQADLKDASGRLVKSLHWFRVCKPTPPIAHPKPKPPVQTHPKPGAHVEGHLPGPGQLAYTASSFDLPLYAGAGGLLVLAGTAVLLAAPLRRHTPRTKR